MYKENDMSRIKKLESHYKKQLEEKDIKDTSFFIQSILNADITKGKYARFLIESFLNDKFLEEDLIGGLNSIVGQAISLFDKHKSKLPLEHRSIYALNPETGKMLYQSPGDLWNSVKQYQGELSGKELKKEEQEQVYRETEFIYKDENTGFQIVSPLTEESAKWWGKSTRWCTSAEKNNQFEFYNKKAPLFILLIPASAGTAGKLQLWKNGNDIQFMDEADNRVSLQYIERYWNILEPICLWLNNLRYIPEHLRIKELYRLAVHENGEALWHIPSKFRTKELCELAVKQNGISLEWVPYELKTLEMCQLAVKNNGLALDFVPYELKTEELCRLAVHENGEALSYVPSKLKTKELCQLAVENNGIALDDVPYELKTEELCRLAVKQNKNALEFVPEELKNKELCELAVQKNKWTLSYVPLELRTEELYKLAIKSDSMALEYVPDELITPELCELAVKQNGKALYHVPLDLKTKELCELAVKQNGLALSYVPSKLRTLELCKIAVENNGMALDDVPYELKTEEMCQLSIQQNGMALEWVPSKLRTLELCKIAIRQNIDAVKYVSEKYKVYTEIYKLECQQKKKEEVFINSKDKHQIIYQKLKEYFPEKHMSLSYHS
jgi:hypothetical protein